MNFWSSWALCEVFHPNLPFVPCQNDSWAWARVNAKLHPSLLWVKLLMEADNSHVFQHARRCSVGEGAWKYGTAEWPVCCPHTHHGLRLHSHALVRAFLHLFLRTQKCSVRCLFSVFLMHLETKKHLGCSGGCFTTAGRAGCLGEDLRKRKALYGEDRHGTRSSCVALLASPVASLVP